MFNGVLQLPTVHNIKIIDDAHAPYYKDFSSCCMQDENDPTLLDKYRRVAFAEVFLFTAGDDSGTTLKSQDTRRTNCRNF